ncbi:hypothetical protein CW304_21700 [Bacillus sp. UFRGS-B20]|nr:hypothetical protein CW304_21700 [Bacillus sp. UFRGS-B20]
MNHKTHISHLSDRSSACPSCKLIFSLSIEIDLVPFPTRRFASFTTISFTFFPYWYPHRSFNIPPVGSPEPELTLVLLRLRSVTFFLRTTYNDLSSLLSFLLPLS